MVRCVTNSTRSRLLAAALGLCVCAQLAAAQAPPAGADVAPSLGEPSAIEAGSTSSVWDGSAASAAPPAPPSDLTLSNFFTAGWDEDFIKRRRLSGTPDFALLRVQTNFLEREFRANYFLQSNLRSPTRENLQDFDALIAWGFNRRLMLELTGACQWVDARKGADLNGSDPGLVGRLQLVDTERSSYSLNFRAAAPNRGLGEQQTAFSYGLAGFEDLAAWLELNRVGLYYSVQFDSLAGPGEEGAKRTDAAYDVTLAKTLTAPDTPLLGNFTVFVENFAQTDLDGAHAGRTLVTITPGVRFNLGKTERVKLGIDNWLLFGVDLPVSSFQPWEALYRFSYITNF